jgi:carboxyl-terminal processing protease
MIKGEVGCVHLPKAKHDKNTMFKKRTFYLFTIGLLSLVAFKTLDNGKYFEIAKNLEIFTNAYKELNHSYVDDLDPGGLMRTGLDAMLGSLDPFTNYISETDIEGYRYLTEGKYNGVGANSAKIGDYVVITEIYENSAALKAGLKAGDQILSVDGQNAKGKSPDEVQTILRGFPGTKVDLTVKRPGEAKDISVTLTREEVNIPNVPHSGIVGDGIGYVNLTVFTRDAGENVAKAFKELKKNNPNMKGLILDLRSNGGGLLAEAVNLCNVFVPKNEFIVSTKGKVQDWDRSFKTLNAAIDTDLPVVVLVNHMSASASEIVSGALQDLDRAVVMGQLTYGKGLVQNTKELGYNAKIKLTTAKYYIPSGRCIQAVRYKDGAPVHIPDSERAKFKTRGGRTVLDGGGVKPDIELPTDTASGVVKALLDQYIIFEYCTEYLLKNPKMDSIELFRFNDWSGFEQFVASKKFTYESGTEKQLKSLRDQATSDGYSKELASAIADLENKLKSDKKSELQRRKEDIVREIEVELAGRQYFDKGRVRMRLNRDNGVTEAAKLLNNPSKYKSVLK